ncbi:hypothetical protein PUMCH_000439 [Australozyma saopauloensis]|uniref:CAP-Gly domain-containing protein n=1 Tax=Australozyma saopauloensis TaxID=291208 RepID=A0AAX4H4U6_9ASCO|nr:hypothetical protein PUMCH_000439 [[Candida] saopauloensis]
MLTLLDIQVNVPGSETGSGIIKYIGPIRGKLGTFAGIEVDPTIAATRGRNNGDVEGVQYFEVSLQGSGLFLPWERLRSVNSHLPPNIRPISRSASTHEKLSTPSPTSRAIHLRVSSSAGTDDRIVFGRESPLMAAPKLNIPKRRVSSRDHQRPPTQGTRATSTGGLISALPENGLESAIEGLRKELDATKLLLESKQDALMKKNAVLEDLQATVNEINPLLREYEASLAEKDKKMQKQKHEYEAAREEWRQSLELMLNAQQETELLYELELADLKEEMKKLVTSRSSPLRSRAHETELANQVRQLKRENEILLSQVQAVQDGDGKSGDVTSYIHRIEDLEVELERTMRDLASTRDSLESAGSEISASKMIISELKDRKLAVSSDRDDLVENMKTLSVQDWELQKSEFEAKIEKLEGALAIAENASLKHTIAETNEKMQLEYEARIKELEAQATSSADLISELTNKLRTFEAGHTVASEAHKDTRELSEAQEQIKELKYQLELRPSFQELTELQVAMDEVETLHKLQLDFKDDKIAQLQKRCEELEIGAKSLKPTEVDPPAEALIKAPQPTIESSSASLPKPLEVYVPSRTTDASAGRDNWCGLCEREGHGSLECPYENDMF